MLERRDAGGSGYFPTASDEPASVASARNDAPAPVVEDAGHDSASDDPAGDLPF